MATTIFRITEVEGEAGAVEGYRRMAHEAAGRHVRPAQTVREDGEPLLDRTMILYGSNLGNANTT